MSKSKSGREKRLSAWARTAWARLLMRPIAIVLGQLQQVLEGKGQPSGKINFLHKMIYVYPDKKSTFVNGKVSDVQELTLPRGDTQQFRCSLRFGLKGRHPRQ